MSKSNDSIKISLFCCLSNFNPDELAFNSDDKDCKLTVIPLPCSGKIDILYLTKAFETGADGVAVVMCKQGDCRYLEGNLRARKRVEAVEELLEETGLGKGRAIVIQMDDSGISKVNDELKDFKSKIKALPGRVLNETR
jgi:coenzyme F420-reducing hydrogenase delta subunit